MIVGERLYMTEPVDTFDDLMLAVHLADIAITEHQYSPSRVGGFAFDQAGIEVMAIQPLNVESLRYNATPGEPRREVPAGEAFDASMFAPDSESSFRARAIFFLGEPVPTTLRPISFDYERLFRCERVHVPAGHASLRLFQK